HATALARGLAAHPRLLCAGGDGTAYEVVNGLMQAGGRPALGMIPLGTGNSFLRDFGITTAARALDAVVADRRRPIDVVRADCDGGPIWYINLLSIGFTSDVGALTNRRFKALGKHGYTVATVIEVARLRHHAFPLRLDGGPTDARPCVFLSFNNSRCTGGDMQMAPSADPSDGRLDVIRVGPMSRLQLLGTFPKIYQGRHVDHPLVEQATAAQVDLDLDGPVDLMVDGEVIRRRLTRLVVLPGALEVIA
ncbi:MAG TPA: YegS/Rv2252/BmrU family lipid kinase, partial [Myxococcota bacterium]|nr:YegS/Rv2252/BmrU family lipid kinase [Myxococcota bacterium]